MTDRCILVAHGTDNTRIVLKNVLREAGYHYVSTARNGRQIFGRLTRGEYDLLITATELSDITCWQLLRAIATGAFCSPRLPVLIVCDAGQISQIELLAQEHRAHALALDELGTLPEIVRACLEDTKKPAVLVIEDHPDTAELIRCSLKAGFEVEIVPSGEAGLDVWRERRHALILLDLMLPGIRGPAVLERVLAEKPDQLVAVITARSERKTHQTLMLAGAAAFLTKPIDLQKLPHLCEKLLHDSAFLNRRAQLEPRDQAARRVIERVRIADYLLEIGQTGLAATQIKHALAQGSGNPLRDDEWIELLSALQENCP